MAAIAVALVLCTIIGGTVAWLVTKTDTVTNTFTYGDINIDLEETPTGKDDDNDNNTNIYPMLPGSELAKDPKITVKKGSESSFLFVALTEKGGNTTVGETTYNFDSYLTYAIADNWNLIMEETAQDGSVTTYYYREVDKQAVETADVVYTVIKDDKVTVKDTVTKEMMNALDKDADGNALANPIYPKLEVTACAVQRDNLTFDSAWAIAHEKFAQ